MKNELQTLLAAHNVAMPAPCWNVGLIAGPAGSGKTLAIRALEKDGGLVVSNFTLSFLASLTGTDTLLLDEPEVDAALIRVAARDFRRRKARLIIASRDTGMESIANPDWIFTLPERQLVFMERK
jgi:RNase adaptor protein for sRNA GlmZ degradation